MKDWKVDPAKKALVLEPSGSLMQASCHHRRCRKPLGACGGCYARAVEALNAIEADPREAVRIVRAVHAATKAEAAPSIPEKQTSTSEDKTNE